MEGDRDPTFAYHMALKLSGRLIVACQVVMDYPQDTILILVDFVLRPLNVRPSVCALTGASEVPVWRNLATQSFCFLARSSALSKVIFMVPSSLTTHLPSRCQPTGISWCPGPA